MPLTNLLKKSFRTYEWDEAHNVFQGFEGLITFWCEGIGVEVAPTLTRILKSIPMPLTFLIGGVIVQNRRQVKFESKTLSETKQRWPTHEKEMWIVIHCLKTWGHYRGFKDVVVWTNNVTLKYFTTQLKLSSKQVRWQGTLALFNVDIRHKHGKDNMVPDVLN
jgi:hypothetical protein